MLILFLPLAVICSDGTYLKCTPAKEKSGDKDKAEDQKIEKQNFLELAQASGSHDHDDDQAGPV